MEFIEKISASRVAAGYLALIWRNAERVPVKEKRDNAGLGEGAGTDSELVIRISRDHDLADGIKIEVGSRSAGIITLPGSRYIIFTERSVLLVKGICTDTETCDLVELIQNDQLSGSSVNVGIVPSLNTVLNVFMLSRVSLMRCMQ